jgi:hypothetical protein
MQAYFTGKREEGLAVGSRQQLRTRRTVNIFAFRAVFRHLHGNLSQIALEYGPGYEPSTVRILLVWRQTDCRSAVRLQGAILRAIKPRRVN